MQTSILTTETTALGGSLILASAPGRTRDLGLDLDELYSKYGVVLLVSLVNDHELDALGITDLVARGAAQRILVRRFHIGDFSTPDSPAAITGIIDEIIGTLRSGSAVAIHCWAGLGRTGLLAACVLVAGGFLPEKAMQAVRGVRPGAIENDDQEEFILDFANVLAAVDVE